VTRALAYANETGYATFTPPVLGAWHTVIVGLTTPMCTALNTRATLELSATEDLVTDPIATFGVLEARRHRERGIGLPMFLGLMKYLRQAYQDLLHDEVRATSEERWQLQRFIDRYFDRIEIAFCGEWVRLAEASSLEVLSNANRVLAGEKTDRQGSFLRRLTDNMVDLIAQIDLAERFVYVSPSYHTVLGYEPRALLGEQIATIFPMEERVTAIERLRDVAGGMVELRCLHHDGTVRWLEVSGRVVRDEGGAPLGSILASRDVTSRKEVEGRFRTLLRAVEQCPVSIVITDRDARIEYVNPRFSVVTGYSSEEAHGQNPRILKSGESSPETYRDLWATISSGREWVGDLHNKKKSGALFWERALIAPVLDERGTVTHYIAVKEDITRQKQLEEERTRMAMELVQARKLEAVGQLAAGIAHEINTPTQFVSDNLHFLGDASRDFLRLIELQEVALHGRSDDAAKAASDRAEAMDLAFLREEVPSAITQALDGTQRISHIVRAMKDFSHPDSGEKKPTDINHAVETTVTVAKNEWKYVAELVLELEPLLPSVPALPGEINQVLLNLIVNAAHAIGEKLGECPVHKGTIIIRSRSFPDCVELRVEDTGRGIDEEHRRRIFEPFFTTKERGRGTGQGLTISHTVVVKKHGGSIGFETESGVGSVFWFRLPRAAQEAS
jgi:PAS domain S-box-containing protein